MGPRLDPGADDEQARPQAPCPQGQGGQPRPSAQRLSPSAAREWPVDDPEAMPAFGAFFAGSPLGAVAFGWTCGVVAGLGPATVRLTATQVAFRHRIGFAWLWLPGRWLAHPDAEVVLTIGLRERLGSQRFKQVIEPYPGRWQHHVEVHAATELDDEVAGWLARAYDAAR